MVVVDWIYLAQQETKIRLFGKEHDEVLLYGNPLARTPTYEVTREMQIKTI